MELVDTTQVNKYTRHKSDCFVMPENLWSDTMMNIITESRAIVDNTNLVDQKMVNRIILSKMMKGISKSLLIKCAYDKSSK